MKKTSLSIALLISVSVLLSGCEIFKEWCKDDEMSVEKTLTLQPGGTDGKDASLFSCIGCGYNDNNYGTHQEFSAIAWTNGGETSNVRVLVQFNLDEIPANAEITSATLSLYHYTSPHGDHSKLSGSNEGLLQRVTASWEENVVTWDTQPSTTTTNQVVLPASTSDTQHYPNINVTNLVRDMVKGDNFGMLFRLQTEDYYRQLIFASSDHPDGSIRPKLVVKYKVKLD